MTWMEDEEETPQPAAEKRRGVGNTSREALLRELNALKITASLRQEMRFVLSIVSWSVLVPLDLAMTAIQAGKKHADRTRGKSKHTLGPPHPHVWRSFLTAVIKKAESLATRPTLLDTVKTYLHNFSANPARHIFYVAQARAKEIKNQMVVVNWSLSKLLKDGPEVDTAILQIMEAVGGDVRPGTSPATPMDRRLQTDIDVLSAQLSKGQGKGQ